MSEDTNKPESRPKLSAVPRFPLGQTVATRTALAVLSSLDIRHQYGDWGEVGREDWQANERALKQGERLLSVTARRQAPDSGSLPSGTAAKCLSGLPGKMLSELR